MKRAAGRIGLMTIAVVLWASPAAGQAVTPHSAAQVEAAKRSMRGTLRCLATAQEVAYSSSYRYSADVAFLRSGLGDCAADDQVQVTIHHASDTGHAMEAKHSLLPEQSCVYAVGRPVPELKTLQQGYPAAEHPGRALCDFDPLPVRR